MNLNLTTWQRANCVIIISSIAGANAGMFRDAVKLLDILEMTDDEKNQVGFSDDAAELECDLTGLKSRFGIDIERVWIADGNGKKPVKRPGDVFIAARITTSQASWEDKAHVWPVEVVDGNLAAMLKEQVKVWKWPQGSIGAGELRVQIIDLLDQLGIDGE